MEMVVIQVVEVAVGEEEETIVSSTLGIFLGIRSGKISRIISSNAGMFKGLRLWRALTDDPRDMELFASSTLGMPTRLSSVLMEPTWTAAVYTYAWIRRSELSS
jgi:hypothetical protein